MPSINPTRLMFLLLLPAVISGLLVYGIVRYDYQAIVAKQQQEFGASTANQLADHVAPIVVEKDILSLNVVITRLAESDHIQYVAVYDTGNRLLAQAGKELRDSPSFADEITFQDSLAGFIRVSVTPPRPISAMLQLSLLSILLVYAALVAFRADALIGWLTPVEQEAEPDDGDEETDADTHGPVEEVTGPMEECILVIRIRPSRYLERDFSKFFKAAELYGGIVEQTTTEELVIHFEGADAVYKATCSGLLIRQLTSLVNGNVHFGGTLDLLDKEPDKVRKAASYLASIAEGELLLASTDTNLGERVELQSFHHSLVDSQNLRRIMALEDSAQIEAQAKEIAATNT